MITTEQFKQIKLFVLYPKIFDTEKEVEVSALIHTNRVAYAIFKAMVDHQNEKVAELRDVLSDVEDHWNAKDQNW